MNDKNAWKMFNINYCSLYNRQAQHTADKHSKAQHSNGHGVIQYISTTKHTRDKYKAHSSKKHTRENGIAENLSAYNVQYVDQGFHEEHHSTASCGICKQR